MAGQHTHQNVRAHGWPANPQQFQGTSPVRAVANAARCVEEAKPGPKKLTTRCAHGAPVWGGPQEMCCFVLCVCPLVPGTSRAYWEREGPQWAKGHFKEYEMCASFLLLTVLCLCEGGVFIQFLWPKCLLSSWAIFGGCNSQDLTTKIACGARASASTPPWPKFTSKRVVRSSVGAGAYTSPFWGSFT